MLKEKTEFQQKDTQSSVSEKWKSDYNFALYGAVKRTILMRNSSTARWGRNYDKWYMKLKNLKEKERKWDNEAERKISNKKWMIHSTLARILKQSTDSQEYLA